MNDPSAPVLNERESFAAIAIAASSADREIHPQEIQSIVGYMLRMRLFRDCNDQQLAEMIGRLLDLVQDTGPAALIRLGKQHLPVELWETAFACAVDIVFSDGGIDASETHVLKEVQAALEVPDRVAEVIFEAMYIKNRG